MDTDDFWQDPENFPDDGEYYFAAFKGEGAESDVYFTMIQYSREGEWIDEMGYRYCTRDCIDPSGQYGEILGWCKELPPIPGFDKKITAKR